MDNDQEKAPVDYVALTLKQADAVEETAKRHQDSPGKDTEMQIEIELEKLCFYQTAAQGNPAIRAQQAAEKARALVLGRAITQPPASK